MSYFVLSSVLPFRAPRVMCRTLPLTSSRPSSSPTSSSSGDGLAALITLRVSRPRRTPLRRGCTSDSEDTSTISTEGLARREDFVRARRLRGEVLEESAPRLLPGMVVPVDEGAGDLKETDYVIESEIVRRGTRGRDVVRKGWKAGGGSTGHCLPWWQTRAFYLRLLLAKQAVAHNTSRGHVIVLRPHLASPHLWEENRWPST